MLAAVTPFIPKGKGRVPVHPKNSVLLVSKGLT